MVAVFDLGGNHVQLLLFYTLTTALVFFSFPMRASAVLHSNQVFRILAGVPGNCDAHLADLDGLVQETRDMATTAIDSINLVLNARQGINWGSNRNDRDVVLKMLKSMFNINYQVSTRSIPNSGEREKAEQVRNKFTEIVKWIDEAAAVPADRTLERWRLACSDDWYKVIDKLHDLNTGANLGLNLDAGLDPEEQHINNNLFEVYPNLCVPNGWTWLDDSPEWPTTPAKKIYLPQKPVGEMRNDRQKNCVVKTRVPAYLLTLPKVLTFCPRAFTGFAPSPGETQDRVLIKKISDATVHAGDKLDSFYSLSGVILHEISHIPFSIQGSRPETVDGPEEDPCYEFARCHELALANAELSRNTADNYRLFSTALSLKGDAGWEFSTGLAKKK